MAYKKRGGSIHCRILKTYPDFIDAVCTKTGRLITFQLKYKMSEGLKNLLEMIKSNNKEAVIFCSAHTEENMYWYSGVSRGQHHGRRKGIMKKIAYEGLMREVEKDFNPVHTGSIKQGLLTGRAGLPTSRNTSGKIGGALIKNIARPNIPIFRELTKLRKERMEKLRNIRQRQISAENKYIEWCIENDIEQDDKSWVKFLRMYESKGKIQEGFIQRVEEDEHEMERLKEDERIWQELRKSVNG